MSPRGYFSLYDLSLFDGDSHLAVMEAYFDASESREGYFTVAGYIFQRPDVRPFERLWGRMLGKRPHLSHFHMTDCNAQADEFEGMGDDCDACAREAIHAISMRATQGIVAGIKVADFERHMKEDGFMPGPFSLCAHSALMMCAQWAEAEAPDARFAYVFEAGDDHQADLNQILNAIDESPERSAMFRYKSHAFHPKRKSYPVQAADVIAWHACKQWTRDERGYGLRGDFDELVRNVPTRKFLWQEDEIIRSIGEAEAAHRGFKGVGRVAGLGIRRTKQSAKTVDRQISEILGRSGK